MDLLLNLEPLFTATKVNSKESEEKKKKSERKMKRWFDPWPVFFKREFNRTWPFLVGFAVTGTIITKFSLGLTEEDEKNSPFAQKHKRLRNPDF
ncbi:Histone superfamily protein [Hibiscus syriacus]|uniref:Histone superfamily protein n=2 Tax=Hibiscus syriacus TaxID=106335 RepID=A0A6A2ZBC6_HIBSY|nr:Histone superfamily protein [Hibiscus syriacus]